MNDDDYHPEAIIAWAIGAAVFWLAVAACFL